VVVDHGWFTMALDRTVLDRNTLRIPFIDFPIIQVLPVKQKFPTIRFFGFGQSVIASRQNGGKR